MQRDRASSQGDGEGFSHAVEPVHENDDIGSFRRGGGAASTHRDPHTGCGKCRGIIDTVPDHHGWFLLLNAQQPD